MKMEHQSNNVFSSSNHRIQEMTPAKRLLYIDDNPGDVSLIRLALIEAEFNCDLTVLSDGGEALAFIRKQEQYSARPTPDLVLLDLHLPKHDGIEVLQVLRTHPEFAAVPVAVLTSGSMSDAESAQVHQFGIACYITKPSGLEDFLEIGGTLKALCREENASGHDSAASRP